MNSMRQPVRFQNTYRLQSKNPFNRDQVEIILKEVMDSHFSKIDHFDARLSVNMCRTVSDEIIEQVKEKKFERYRIIVVVSVIEKFMQDVNYSNKNLWDPAKDSNVTYVVDNPMYTAIGICYAIYYE